MCTSFPYHLYLVISQHSCGGRDFLKVAEQALRGGVDLIQLREKNCAAEEYISLASELKKITDRFNVPLIINDDIDVMRAVHAAGIHVGNSDASPVDIRSRYGDQYFIGYSVEQIGQVSSEKAGYSDYIAASPVFKTSTKKDTIAEWGLEGIREIRRSTTQPLVAIGNLHKDNAAAVINAGADCIAVVSSICLAADPELAAFELKQIIRNEKRLINTIQH